MTTKESVEQLNSLIEHFNNGGNDFNATDIEAIQCLLKENQELNKKYLNAVADYKTTMFEKEQLNSLVNSCQEEIRELKKLLQERPKEYVFIGNAQNKTRDFINQITKDNKEFKNQQKEFIEYLEDLIKQNETVVEVSKYGLPKNCSKLLIDFYKEILSKYKEIIGRRY